MNLLSKIEEMNKINLSDRIGICTIVRIYQYQQWSTVKDNKLYLLLFMIPCNFCTFWTGIIEHWHWKENIYIYWHKHLCFSHFADHTNFRWWQFGTNSTLSCWWNAKYVYDDQTMLGEFGESQSSLFASRHFSPTHWYINSSIICLLCLEIV